MRAFISHATSDAGIALELTKHLRYCLDGEVFYFEDYERDGQGFQARINEEIELCHLFVLIVGSKLEKASEAEPSYQVDEALNFWRKLKRQNGATIRRVAVIYLRNKDGVPYELPSSLADYEGQERFELPMEAVDVFGSRTRLLAFRIVHKLQIPWRSQDDLPQEPHLFSSESEIASFFETRMEGEVLGDGRAETDGDDGLKPLFSGPGEDNRYSIIRERTLLGCPGTWPEVQHSNASIPNPVPEEIVGKYRDHTAEVLVSARARRGDGSHSLRILEAGPRRTVKFGEPGRPIKVAILVSGGIAPGTNAVIDGIVQRHKLYGAKGNYHVTVLGITGGFSGFTPFTFRELTAAETASAASGGGSILTTSRAEELFDHNGRLDRLARIATQLADTVVDILYVIGGDGSMRAAHALWAMVQDMRRTGKLDRDVAVVGVPKTMDNDILWVWQSFGFLTAVEKAREVVKDLSTEVASNPRICVVQLFGSDSGFVVSHAVLASSAGTCDAALIPEVPFCTHGVARHLVKTIYGPPRTHRSLPSGMVVMAETAIPLDAVNYLETNSADSSATRLTDDEVEEVKRFDAERRTGRRIQGQTPDELRNAGMKILKRGLTELLPVKGDEYRRLATQKVEEIHWDQMRLFTSEPRHLLRAIAPNTVDLISAQRLGLLAVDNALGGYTDFMISQWLTEYVIVPLKLVTLGRKHIPEDGMFWKSVLAKTGQPTPMVCTDCRKKFGGLLGARGERFPASQRSDSGFAL